METLGGMGRAERIIRKSRFVAVCGPCRDEAAARNFVHTHGEADCRHVCWAFTAGSVQRFDDAGEPGGTAGRPILAAIEQQGLDRVVAVVSRYFGGIKLGTGGLTRAYGGTAGEALQSAPRQPLVQWIAGRCHVPFESTDPVHRLLEKLGARKSGEDFDTEGLRLTFRIPETGWKAFVTELTALTRGRARIRRG